MTRDVRSGKPTASFAAMRQWLPAAIETSMKKPCPKAGPEVEAHPVQILREADRAGTLARKPPRDHTTCKSYQHRCWTTPGKSPPGRVPSAGLKLRGRLHCLRRPACTLDAPAIQARLRRQSAEC